MGAEHEAEEAAVRTDFAQLSNADLARQLAWITWELKERLKNYVEAARESHQAADDGLVLACRAQRVARDASWTFREAQAALEEIGVYEHEEAA